MCPAPRHSFLSGVVVLWTNRTWRDRRGGCKTSINLELWIILNARVKKVKRLQRVPFRLLLLCPERADSLSVIVCMFPSEGKQEIIPVRPPHPGVLVSFWRRSFSVPSHARAEHRWNMSRKPNQTVCCRQCVGEGVEECRFCAGTGMFKVRKTVCLVLPVKRFF